MAGIKKVEITETELRGLIFWATQGIEKSRGGSYYSILDFIRGRGQIMTYNKKRYKKLEFATQLKDKKYL